MMPNTTGETTYRVKGLHHRFGEQTIDFPDIEVSSGDHLLIFGQSGSGKTTLLHLLSGLISIQEGEIEALGKSFSAMNRRELDAFRGAHIGLVFQQARFIKALNVADNLAAGQFFGKGKLDKKRILATLDALGITHLAEKNTNGLSGGERQRLGIARAIVSNPKIILADEPTSSLDDANTERVAQLLLREAQSLEASLIVVSHDSRLRAHFQNRLEI